MTKHTIRVPRIGDRVRTPKLKGSFLVVEVRENPNLVNLRLRVAALLLLGMLGLIVACGGGKSQAPPLPPPPTPAPTFTLVKLSMDTFTNPDSQHATELETSSFSFGSTLVTSFEVARGNGHGGGADLGFATSTDAGASWTSGFLSGLTVVQGGTATATGNAPLAKSRKKTRIPKRLPRTRPTLVAPMLPLPS